MPALLQIENLSINYGAHRAVHNVSLLLKKGERFAIIGESGSGKTSLALSIPGLLPSRALTSGKIHFDGQLLDAKTQRQYRGTRIGMIFQEPLSALNPLHSIGKQVGEALRVHQSLSGVRLRENCLELLRMAGLGQPESIYDRLPQNISGGQRQRALIAMALANRPDLLIADEPTSALDASVQQQIIQTLLRLGKELNMAILLNTHNLLLARQLANSVAVMKQGEIIESGEASKLFSAPRHDYTKLLLGSLDIARAPRSESTEPFLRVENLSVKFPAGSSFFVLVLFLFSNRYVFLCAEGRLWALSEKVALANRRLLWPFSVWCAPKEPYGLMASLYFLFLSLDCVFCVVACKLCFRTLSALCRRVWLLQTLLPRGLIFTA